MRENSALMTNQDNNIKMTITGDEAMKRCYRDANINGDNVKLKNKELNNVLCYSDSTVRHMLIEVVMWTEQDDVKYMSLTA